MTSKAPTKHPNEHLISRAPIPHTRSILGLYTRVSIAYFLLIYTLWIIGIEGIYAHPAPFYAIIYPAFTAPNTLWLLQALLFPPIAILFTINTLQKNNLLNADPSPKSQRRLIAAFVLLAFTIPLSIAMIRGGLHGVSQAYNRQALEYISDIGVGGSLHGLFNGYERYHQYLSMHSKVHPPGPIAILWIMSFLVGRTALALSLSTMAFGALSVIPFYLWTRDLFGYKTALHATLLYIFVPTIVLFTATSADITFMPFTLTTLFLFWRSITRGSLRYALAAGITYALCSLISFSLIGVGAFFGLVGLWKLRDSATRPHVAVTTIGMLITLLLTHYLIWLWSDFNIFRVFEISKLQFDTDQHNLDLYDPRYPAWTFRFLNPLSWFYFAGIPVSVLAIKQLFNRTSDHRPIFIIIGITLLALDILYLARGEGERSAMYIMPFLVIPAGYYLTEITQRSGSTQPLTATLLFLALQCWFTETILYTYW